ncbi:Kinesin light chain protein [Rutstroemia sp. NJR-2017a BBW]|nr:Kinesin light chain protein [Rutstroemia sp. NJR-2017a BBW]
MPGNDLRLLALDGGGVRGLSTLMILQQLMETIDPEHPPKPCDYFDMIGGTSTGGLIAIMLGRLRMSIDDCIDAYLSLSDRIFQKKRHRVTVKGAIQGRFDSDELAHAVREVVVAQGLPENTLLKDVSDGACKVFVCATSKETSETVCLTSYPSPRGRSDLLNSIKIWEACRATSAASSFFDPIAVGRYGEGFVDGATGANNPVWEVWNQAQLLWGPQPLEGKIKCLVSIGTGVPSLKPFRDDVFHIGKTLVAIATETGQTAERFRRDKTHLDDSGRYYRFNVDRGLEEVGLEESKKRKEIAAATGRYIGSQGVFKQMQACADNMAGKEYFGEYRIVFHLQHVPKVSKFIARPAEMTELEQVLLPDRQKAIGTPRSRWDRQDAASGRVRITAPPKVQCRVLARWEEQRQCYTEYRKLCEPDTRRPDIPVDAGGSTGDINAVVREVMDWLAREENEKWLLVFDNVDRDYDRQTSNVDVYDIQQYLCGVDHGSILITTRLAKLAQLGDSQQLGKVSLDQARSILQSRYKGKYDPAEDDRLLSILDGLPLAIAQAAAFLQETGIEPRKYIEFYERKWKELMKSGDWEGAPLQDYPDRSVWTTWTISYETIRETNKAAANLLLLWAFLDCKDLWYGLFTTACEASETVTSSLLEWIGGIANDELQFTKAMRLLWNYSLVERVSESRSYATHPVVHQWAYHFQETSSRAELAQIAVMVVGWAVPSSSSQDYTTLQRRLLPHAQVCFPWVESNEIELRSGKGGKGEEQEQGGRTTSIYPAIHLLGDLYANQGKLDEAEKMYQRALEGNEKALGTDHTSTLNTVNNLGSLYANQGKLDEAEKMYQQALKGEGKALGADHISTLSTVNNLGILYADQGKLDEAEKMYQRALEGKGKALGADHISTLSTVNNLGILYANQGKLDEAEKMYQRALLGTEKALGADHTSTLDIVNNLGLLYANQGKLDEAEKMYQQALEGNEKALGTDHTSTLSTVNNLGSLYMNQGKLDEAEKIYQRALEGYEKALGANAQRYIPALNAIWGLASLFERQADSAKARIFYSKALNGYEKAVGPDHLRSQELQDKLRALDTAMENDDLIEVRELVNVVEEEVSDLSARGRPSKSKRHRLLNKLGLR